MDMFTLHIEHAVLLGLFTVLTWINCRLHDSADGAYWFPAYSLCAFIGAILIVLRGHGVSDVVSVVVGTAFFHLAYLCVHRGVDGFFDRKTASKWASGVQVVLVPIAIGGLIEFGAVHPNTARRVIFYSVIFVLQTGLIAGVLFRKARGPVATSGMLMGGLLALIATNNLIRAYITWQTGAPTNYSNGGLGLQLSLLETTVLQAGIMVAFVWMTAAVLHHRLETLASTDSLTGLLNRRALEFSVEQEIELSRRKRRPLTAILIDLDRFKQINDRFGHAFGDRTLLEVSRCLHAHMRQSDLLARVGGDEFAVVLHNTNRDGAMVIAERLRASLEDLVVMEGEVQARVSASFGLAQVDGDTVDWNDLVRKCDKAVYAVKDVGGNLAAAH